MTAEIAIIGDIHGQLSQLDQAITWALDSADKVVLIGDYVDFGSNSRGVLESLGVLREVHGDRLVFLRGNHDEELFRFIKDGNLPRYLSQAGARTFSSYGPYQTAQAVDEFRESFPSDHLELIKSMPDYLETSELLISHMGIDPDRPDDRSRVAMVMKPHRRIFTVGLTLPKSVICGHYVRSDRKPLLTSSLIAIDTGCGVVLGAPLTCLLWPSRRYRQFWEG